MNFKFLITYFCAAIFYVSTAQATTILYDQDFENPQAFVNDGGDVNIFNSVNTLYGNQPAGFTFAQAFTVETLLITGDQAVGTGYSDPSGIGGNYALGMLSGLQNDLIGLSFNVGSNDFLNVSLDISSIDLSVFSGPFVPQGIAPVFEFILYDNPTGANGLGSGAILSTFQATGTASDQTVFDWTQVLLPLATSGNTNGNVTLQIDLLVGGYAALDNFLIAASDTPGDTGDTGGPSQIPEPGTLVLICLGFTGLVFSRRRYKA